MERTNRINEVLERMESFRHEYYFKQELLEEYLRLERETIELTFNREHVELSNIRLVEVKNHFEALNLRYGNKADLELAEFNNYSYELYNEIKRMKSGAKGEYQTSKVLETLRCPCQILNNIELSKGDHKTEIDFIVITQKAIYILEVKNTQKDVKIDEAGNLIKVGYSEVFEKPLAENMNEKEYLVRSILEEAGYKNLKIISLVVFANSRINVENNYKHLEHCFLGSLPKIIDGNEDDYLYTIKNISKMAKEISFAEQKEKYVPSFDVESYKVAYAKLIAKIEDAALEQENENIIEEPKIPFYKTKIFKKIGRVAMCIAGVLSIKTAVKMAKN